MSRNIPSIMVMSIFAITNRLRKLAKARVRKRASGRLFIRRGGEEISIFAAALVNCDENNIPRRCERSYILSADWFPFPMVDLQPLLPRDLSPSSTLSERHSMFVIVLGRARRKFTLGSGPSGAISFYFSSRCCSSTAFRIAVCELSSLYAYQLILPAVR